MREQIDRCIIDGGSGQALLSDIHPSAVPVVQICLRDWNALDVSTSDYRVVVRLIDVACALHPFLVTYVQSDLVFGIEFPFALVLFEGEANDISKCELVLICSINLMAIIDYGIGQICVLVSR